MERMTREGRFVCTAEEPGGHVSALSLESLEFSALCGKACVVALSLQGTMSLQRSHLQPYCILTMPTDPQQLEDILNAGKLAGRLAGKLADDALTDETRQALRDDAADSRDAANAGLFDAVLDTGDLGSAYEELHAWMTHQLVASDDADSRPLTPDSLDDSPPAASARLSVFSAPRWGRGLRSCGVVERSASQSCVEEASGWKRWESAYRALTTTPAAHTVRNTCTAKVEGSQTLTFNVSDPDALPPDSPDSTLPSLPSSRLDRPDSATCCSKSPISDRSARDGGAACGATIEGAADDAEFGLGSSLGSRPGSKCSPYPVLPAIAGR
ncbi:PREDICTED: uncharacterized protein LOC106817645 [Priapulus caudatus]|uniref:Uncharacterized protein LOC106817645 n=1 Tax=Priapulus caudatus TaxID=37621 RepID=A0ABM1F047_PRICU|nr:PREDICTED: uncharacterized protein LOC106817645 [Priapulus caudatus]